MFRNILFTTVLLIGQLSLSGAYAQDYPEEPVLREISSSADSGNSRNGDTVHNSKSIPQLDKMTVTASGKQRLIETSQSLSVIKSDQWLGTSKSLADVIAEQSGVQTRRYGGTGAFQTVSVRGILGSEVLVLLDGIPLNSAMGGAADLSLVNTSRIGEIELYKGVTPVIFGGNSLGGVINLRSKEITDGTGLDFKSSIGAYGYRNFSVNAFHSPQQRTELFGSLNYSGSENNWLYLSRNRTPLDNSDDSKKRIYNHGYSELSVREHTKFNLNSGYQLKGAIAYSKAKRGIPANEGHINPTARYDTDLLDVTVKLDNGKSGPKTGLSMSPGINLLYLKDYNFWTSLDQDIGNSHGKISLAPNSRGEAESAQRKAELSLLTQYYLSELLGGDLVVFAEHSDILTKTSAGEFVDSDWPASSQHLTFAGQVNAALPSGKSRWGAFIGGSVSGIRNKTQGGIKELYADTVPPSSDIDFSFSVQGGLSFHFENCLTLFFNAGRYSDTPDLRERFGTRGAVLSNPKLREETGKSWEAGVKYLHNRTYAEITPYLINSNNGIVMLSDGNMTKPVNLAKSLSCGVEINLSFQPFSFLRTELSSTVQKTENRSTLYDSIYYGKLLPNEPPVSAIAKVIWEPLRGWEIHYWADYKSPFYRDFGNTEGKRVPNMSVENNLIPGLVFHNGMIVWKAKCRLECRLSLRNVTGISIRYEELANTTEGGQNWVLYPSNEWCFTLGYSF